MQKSDGVIATPQDTERIQEIQNTARQSESKYQFKIGIYGWRKKCLYILILGLLIMVIINLALTLWVLKVMEFSSQGMGQLRIVAGGLRLEGRAYVIDALIASTIRSRAGQPIVIESSKNFTITTRNTDGVLDNRIFLGNDRFECLTDNFKVINTKGSVLFSADHKEVILGVDLLRITGEGGTIFHGSVQTPLLRAESGHDLRLESPTRSLEMRAPMGINVESRAGDIKLMSLNDIKLKSVAGQVRLESSSILMPQLPHATSSPRSMQRRFRKLTQLDKGLGPRLPEAYKKFYKEWKLTEPAAVHYIPEEGRWKRDDVTGEVHPVQNCPIPVRYPPEHDDQLWGGEGVVQGFQKRHRYDRRVPHFWIPHLRRSVVHSEILNKYISVVITSRTIKLINENYGFDHYLLKTLACDLKSLLAVALKRKILFELSQDCPSYKDDPEKQQLILNRYKKYLDAYTPEEIEWYGYSFDEACKKYEELVESQKIIMPLKHVYRTELIEKLKAAAITESQGRKDLSESGSWIQKINPFSKKHET
ncbi:hypothetical protein FQA39_LY15125 [Lamprigera yunnana]|nr:hypothetical protein FQA39_LY15125 [Lamprigera yunnana]